MWINWHLLTQIEVIFLDFKSVLVEKMNFSYKLCGRVRIVSDCHLPTEGRAATVLCRDPALYLYNLPVCGRRANLRRSIATRENPEQQQYSYHGNRNSRYDFHAAVDSLYISRLPSAARIANTVRSPSFNMRVFPHEIELPEVAVQIFAADVVVDTYDAALYESMAALRRVCVNVPARKFLC
jgi:hypothetical protein